MKERLNERRFQAIESCLWLSWWILFGGELCKEEKKVRCLAA